MRRIWDEVTSNLRLLSHQLLFQLLHHQMMSSGCVWKNCMWHLVTDPWRSGQQLLQKMMMME